jgi:hypothetical protein
VKADERYFRYMADMRWPDNSAQHPSPRRDNAPPD